jgi:hypothetical protein
LERCFFEFIRVETGKGGVGGYSTLLNQPIWLNPLIKIGGNMCMNKICCENGVFFVNDLISENKMLFTYKEFINHYNIRLNFIEYFSILSAIPHRWKLLIRGILKIGVSFTVYLFLLQKMLNYRTFNINLYIES